MTRVNLKPLSVNKAWRGRRFKTPEYKTFERSLLLMLPKGKAPQGKLELNLELGFSSKLSDLSNPLKLIEDILQKKYGFNDRNVFRIVMNKKLVKKGEEYIEFNIKKL